MISSVGSFNISLSGGVSEPINFNNSSTVFPARAGISCLTVVSGTGDAIENTLSSKPVTDTSRGT